MLKNIRLLGFMLVVITCAVQPKNDDFDGFKVYFGRFIKPETIERRTRFLQQNTLSGHSNKHNQKQNLLTQYTAFLREHAKKKGVAVTVDESPRGNNASERLAHLNDLWHIGQYTRDSWGILKDCHANAEDFDSAFEHSDCQENESFEDAMFACVRSTLRHRKGNYIGHFEVAAFILLKEAAQRDPALYARSAYINNDDTPLREAHERKVIGKKQDGSWWEYDRDHLYPHLHNGRKIEDPHSAAYVQLKKQYASRSNPAGFVLAIVDGTLSDQELAQLNAYDFLDAYWYLKDAYYVATSHKETLMERLRRYVNRLLGRAS